MARPRRRYPPYDPRYDPRYDPYGRAGWGPGPGYGYGYRPRGSCLRDACLLETGCCLAESLDGNCLLAAVLLVPQFAGALLHAPAPGRARTGRTGRTGRTDRTGRTGRSGGSGSSGDSGSGRRPGAAAQVVTAIGVYQREISAHRPPVCRFTPSCSAYAAEALEQHGALRGGLLAAGRLLRCRPGGRRGADPVPSPREPRNRTAAAATLD